MSSFTKIAPHYEDLMSGVPYAMWLSYLKLMWSKLGAKPQSVLEVCCGTGTLCRRLRSEGYDVAGVDLSADMIREARRLAKSEFTDGIRFFTQDASAMKLGMRFDAAFSFFDSLNYITDPARCAAAIARTAMHLQPGGSFLFDLNTAFAFEQNMFDQEDMKAKTKVRHKWKSRYNKRSRICTVDMRFWAGGEEFREVHVQRAHSVEEIESWMLVAGFEDVRFFDAYTLNPVRARSDRIHVVGVKA
jgi:SAM-dependent methyltransferase